MSVQGRSRLFIVATSATLLDGWRLTHTAEVQELEIDIAADGTIVVLGDVDASSASRFADAVHATASAVIIDVRGCSFMDSTGISVLVEAKTLAEARSAPFELVEPSVVVSRLLEVCGMSSFLGLAELSKPD
jgi:anti-anti-sigma factor